jgi:hypothetical protein
VTTATVTQDRDRLKATRQRLYRRCKRLAITHDLIAHEAKCTRTHVVNYFAGRVLGRGLVGDRVRQTIDRLLAEKAHAA